MIDGTLFDKLVCFRILLRLCGHRELIDGMNQEEIARIIRGNNLPFGGIQVINILKSHDRRFH